MQSCDGARQGLVSGILAMILHGIVLAGAVLTLATARNVGLITVQESTRCSSYSSAQLPLRTSGPENLQSVACAEHEWPTGFYNQ